MVNGSARSSSAQENLRAAICVLALIAQRPQDLNELLSRHETNGDQNDENFPADSGSATTMRSTAASYDSTDFEDSAEDLDIVGVDESEDKQANLAALPNKFLDRLAETLARFKSDPRQNRASRLDSKHVSSTMMIVYRQPEKVRFLCAKNEGLNQGDTTEDTDFLDSWKEYMECISKKGPTAEEAKASLFALVLNYQRPRINHYVKKLQDAFEADKSSKSPSQTIQARLSETWLQKIPSVRSRTWINDMGDEFKLRINPPPGVEAESEAAETGDSLRNIKEEVDAIFGKIDRLCHSGVAISAAAAEFTDSQKCLLKEVMAATLGVLKSVRHRSAIEARLRHQFQNAPQGPKRERMAMTALKFLCRVYLGVLTFIDAAENMPMFQSIECDPIKVPPPQFQLTPSRQTPMQVIKGLGIRVTGEGWAKQLEQEKTKDYFYKLRKQKCHMHAELQVLCHHDTSYTPKDESYYVHPYIGCSKRCCLLCYCFILAHGGFKLRGTHETIINIWELPANSHSQFRSATKHLFNLILAILRDMLQTSYPPTHVELLAQSSAALSTVQTVHDRESGQMEKSQLNMRRMMMMPIVTNNGILVTELPEKPGFAYVVGGTLREGREMPLEEAEIYKENHIRSKLGFEKQEEMPPKQDLAPRICRRCQKPSSLRCSACRTSYCSRLCQRKSWKRHVFVCAVSNRPNDFDRLKIILSQRFRMAQDETVRSQLLMDLFSDNHLCRTFGFVNCIDYAEVANLLCIYGHMMHTFKSRINRMETENLGDLIHAWAAIAFQAVSNNGHSSSSPHCIPWFLEQRNYGFHIPNWEGEYVYQTLAVRDAEAAFSLRLAAEDPTVLSTAERAVLSLYAYLFRPFNNLPDTSRSEWANFGFCFCANNDQRRTLAKAYLELAESGASLAEIAHAWETSSLSQLMKVRGLDVSFFKTNGIYLRRPDVNELGIYRLMAEVRHTLSGRFCDCFRPKGGCHPKHETHLNVESDGDYGFHSTSAWERWQLLNFYDHVFQHPGFQARKMQQARRDPDPGMLERYLDLLVPDFRQKIGNEYLADAMFPKLKARVEFPQGRLLCYCVVHNVLTSEGLDWTIPLLLENSLEQKMLDRSTEND